MFLGFGTTSVSLNTVDVCSNILLPRATLFVTYEKSSDIGSSDPCVSPMTVSVARNLPVETYLLKRYLTHS